MAKNSVPPPFLPTIQFSIPGVGGGGVIQTAADKSAPWNTTTTVTLKATGLKHTPKTLLKMLSEMVVPESTENILEEVKRIAPLLLVGTPSQKQRSSRQCGPLRTQHWYLPAVSSLYKCPVRPAGLPDSKGQKSEWPVIRLDLFVERTQSACSEYLSIATY